MSTPNNDINENNIKIAVEPPRAELINTAVKFLQNPNVAKTAFDKREKFLRSKGLSDEEIKIAFQRLGSTQNGQTISNLPSPVLIPQYIQPQPSIFLKIRDILQSVAIIGGVTYAIYLFYKKYVEPWLFGNQRKKKKTVEERIVDLEKLVTKSVTELRVTVSQVHEDVDKLSNQQTNDGSTVRQLAELKAEIVSVKGLLLNRKQFPPLTANSPVMPPSIPAWQLSSAVAAQEGDSERTDPEDKDLMEMGSGSGSNSSETEVVTKNSDSSLEIM